MSDATKNAPEPSYDEKRLAALEREREHYASHEMDDRLAEVDAEIAQYGSRVKRAPKAPADPAASTSTAPPKDPKPRARRGQTKRD